MHICKLCQKNAADKTGSHIVPHWLLKRVFNLDGVKGRDAEIGFMISDTNNLASIGRRISLDDYREMFGSPSDELINSLTEKILVEDFVFCSSCEKRFSIVETEYAKAFHSSALNKRGELDISPCLGILFWASVLWRFSINNSAIEFRMAKKLKSKLRLTLDRFLPINSQGFNFEMMINDELMCAMKYKIIRSEQAFNGGVIHPNRSVENPFFIWINDLVVMFWVDKSSVGKTFWGFENVFKNQNVNSLLTNVTIGIVDEMIFKQAIQNTIDNLTYRREYYTRSFLDHAFKELTKGKYKMPDDMKALVLNDMALDKEFPRFKRYTIEHATVSMINVLKRSSIIK